MSLPEDISEDCVNIVLLLAKCDSEEILLKAEWTKRIRETADRVERYKQFQTVMNREGA